MCNEHGVAESECGICHPELVPGLAEGESLKIRFGSEKATLKAGVETSKAKLGTVSDKVDVYAEIVFNQNKLAHISLPVRGIIRSVEVDLGKQVEQGELLARVSSVGISQAIGDYIRALAEGGATLLDSSFMVFEPGIAYKTSRRSAKPYASERC